MLKVKVFDENHEKDLEESINEFLEEEEDEINVIDIKFAVSCFESSSSDQIFCYSALLIYKKK